MNLAFHSRRISHSENNHYSKGTEIVLLKLLTKFIIIQINRTGVTSKDYVLPIAEDKAGSYYCKVTAGSAASSYSVTPSTITTTGLLLGIAYLMIHDYRRGSL